MSTESDKIPGATDYRTIDGRAVVRCPICGSHLEYRDKAKHTQWHKWLVDLWDRLISLENPQAKLFDEPPF